MKGKVIWITGLAGSGKTTIGNAIYLKKKELEINTVFLDGDLMRNIFCESLGYSYEERKVAAQRYSKLCKYLSDQGINIICSTISMFNEVRNWNRNNIENYVEVYLKVPIKILKQRNQKQLYTEKNNVVGIDIGFEEPEKPDLIILNDGKISIENIVEKILNI